MNLIYSLLNFDRFEQLIQYEEAFFQAFMEIDKPLLHNIWQWDYKNKRLKTLISYENQRIYLCHDEENNLIGAMSININQQLHQFSQFGFQIEKKIPPFGEVLVMFKNPAHSIPWWRYYNNFIKYTYKHLQESKIYELYMTCASERLLHFYLRGSWKLLDTKFIGEEVRYFLRLNLFAAENIDLVKNI